MASAGSVRAGGAFIEIYAKDTRFQQALARVQARLRAVGATMQALGTSMSLIGTAIGIPMVLAARSAAKFEDAILGMKAAAGLSADEVAMVEKAALELSKTMGVAPAGVAEAFLELLKAGMSVEQVLAGAGEAAVQFARVSGVSMADAAVFMKVAMNTFAVSAVEAVDTLSAAADASETSIAAMVESFGLVGSAGALFNQSLFDISQSLAVLARFGIKGEEAGTGIKTMLMRLTSPSQEAEDALHGVGLSLESFRNAEGNLLPIVQIVGILEQALQGVDQVMRDRILGQVFGDRGIRVVGAFLNFGVGGFEQMAEAMQSNLPVAAKFEILMSGITGAIEKMFAAVQRLSIAFATALGPNIGKAANAAVKFIDIVAALIAAFPGVSTAVVGATISLVGLGIALIAVGLAFKGLAAAVAVFAAVMALLTSPIGLAAAALVAGVALMLTNMYQLSPAFKAEMDGIMAAAMALDFRGAWELMNINLAIALVKFQKHFHDSFSAVKNSVMGASDFIGDMLIEGLDRFLGLFGTDILYMQGQLERLGLYFKAAFDWGFWIDGLDTALDAVDKRVNEAREKLPDADARAAERRDNREKRDAARKAADADRKDGFDPTIAELKAERDRIKARNKDQQEQRKVAQVNAAKQPDLQMPMDPAGGGGVFGKSLGTFSSATSGRIGAGPELSSVAANTGRAADLLQAILDGQVMQPIGDINVQALNAALANIQQAVPPATIGGDEPLMSPLEQVATATSDSAVLLRQLLNETRSGGAAFA